MPDVTISIGDPRADDVRALVERTLEEHRKLIEPAGYTFTREVSLGATATGQQAPWHVLEFRRD